MSHKRIKAIWKENLSIYQKSFRAFLGIQATVIVSTSNSCQLTDLFLMETEVKYDRQECRQWNQTNGWKRQISNLWCLQLISSCWLLMQCTSFNLWPCEQQCCCLVRLYFERFKKTSAGLQPFSTFWATKSSQIFLWFLFVCLVSLKFDWLYSSS